MTQWELDRQQEAYVAAGDRYPRSAERRSPNAALLQWGTVGLVGALLGLFLLRVISLSSPWPALLLIAATVPFVAMIAGTARRVLLTVIVLDIPFQWGIHLNYDSIAGNRGAIGGLGISVTTIALTALYALWLADVLANRRADYRAWLRPALPLAAYVALAALSIVVARDAGFALNEVSLLVQTFLLYIYVASTVRTRGDVKFMVGLLLVSLLLESLVILATQFLGPGLKIPGVTTHFDATSAPAATTSGLSRAVGSLSSPNVAASFLSLLLAPAFAALLARVGGGFKALAFGALALGGLAIVVTFSRGGWIAFATSMAVLLAVGVRRRWVSPLGPAAVVVAAALLFAVFQESILTRLADEEAAAGRLPLIALALSMIQAHPWLGVGSNNFYAVMPQYLTPDFSGAWLYVVHNKYLLVWAETGVFALGAFVTFLFMTVYTGWKVASQGDSFLGPLALGLTAAIVGVMVHMSFDIFNGQPQVQGLWLVAALLVAMRNIQAGEQRGAR